MNTQVAVSALLVFTSTDTEGYALTQLWETGVGTVVMLILAPFLFPANPLTAARAELARVAAGLAGALRASAALAHRVDDDDKRALLHRVSDDIAGLSADLKLLGTQLASAARSARWIIVRRSAMRATAALEPTRRLAVRLARNLDVFATELVTFSARPEYAGDPSLRLDLLDRVVQPLERAMTAALAGRPYTEDLERAQAARAEFVATDHGHVGSILRRPLHRMIEELAAFAQPED